MRTLLAVLGLSLALCGSATAQSSSLSLPANVAATTALASSITVSGQHILLGFHITSTAVNGAYALVFDASSPPADGAVQPGGCFVIPPPVSPMTSATLSMANTPLGTQTQSGIVVVVSTTGCFTKTATTAYISVLYQ